ncbi:hypothetical protein EJ03DRAFT_337805 [Teratosphaeria nubilosa]|uniref:Concanavalin A-like lectin/glucanase n=1 Tax=Teratosphaeria nubilosa TaxID=161662 RepID=A0A6G1L3D7_9PEZI|nr:hypothetical protein EJ03DRAFT_337805 [Teratosphaeria nubilosa]
MFLLCNPATFLAITALLGPVATANFGPNFCSGKLDKENFVLEAESILVLPDVPSDNTGFASLWLGMGTSNGDLIQANVVADGQPSTVFPDIWEVQAYVLKESGFQQRMHGGTATRGDRITLNYKYNPSTGNYDQTVMMNDAVIATLSTESGQAMGVGSAVECATEVNCGTMGAHQWLNTRIVLNVPDKHFGKNSGKVGGVTTGAWVTTDGGRTWTMEVAHIPEYKFS